MLVTISYLLEIPLELSLIGVLLGSFIAIGLLGHALLIALSRPKVSNQLRTYGLIFHQEDA